MATIRSQSVLSAVLLSEGSLIAAWGYAMPHSSYICAHVGAARWVVPWLQNLAAILDSVLLVLIDVLLSRTSNDIVMKESISLLGWLSIVRSSRLDDDEDDD